jgi:hypothetical protein
MHKLSLSVRFVIAPLAFIARTIGPKLGAETISHTVEPLSSVYRAILECEGTLGYATILISCLIVFLIISSAFISSPHCALFDLFVSFFTN